MLCKNILGSYRQPVLAVMEIIERCLPVLCPSLLSADASLALGNRPNKQKALICTFCSENGFGKVTKES